ncbi:MAG: hypothetical protein IMF11_22450 [Proteobacteria bacterium]|nr:hypothetical protein [Pseudomonadota bacterium]
MMVTPRQAVAQISLVTALMLVGSPVESVYINEFCVVAGSLSDHIQPLFPWDGLTILEPQCFGYVSHDDAL